MLPQTLNLIYTPLKVIYTLNPKPHIYPLYTSKSRGNQADGASPAQKQMRIAAFQAWNSGVLLCCLGFGVWDQGIRFRASELGFRDQGLGIRAEGFPESEVQFWGVPIIRIIIFGGVYIGSPYLRKRPHTHLWTAS